LRFIGPGVTGGGGVDTERSLHFNYYHQLSRKYNHESSNTLLNQLFQEQKSSNFAIQHSATAIVAELPPLLSGRQHLNYDRRPTTNDQRSTTSDQQPISNTID